MEVEKYKSLLLEELEKSQYASWLKDLKLSACDDLLRSGIPNKKTEKYKYSDLSSVLGDNVMATNNGSLTSAKPLLNGAQNIFLSDGEIITSDLDKKMIIGNTMDALLAHSEIVSSHLGSLTKNEDGFVSLNTMFFNSGFFLHIPRSYSSVNPIQILNNSSNLLSQCRNLIVVEENAEVEIYFFDSSSATGSSLSHTVTEIFAGANSRISIIHVQRFASEHKEVSHTFIRQERSSIVNTITISLEGEIIRNNLKIVLNDTGAEHNHRSLFIADNQRHIDNYTFLNHAKENGVSNQHIKGILKDRSTGAFSGMILVSPDAQKTAAYQRNNNLLLSNDARMNTRPQLEIYADDVKCSHGATVGQLDKDALFYLRSRGLSADTARQLLVQGFAAEIIDAIPSEECKNLVLDWVLETLQR